MANDNWTTDELKITILAYIEMLNKQLKEEKYSKTEYIQNIINSGVNRNNNSVRRRMYNISAIFEDIGLPIVKGYLPLRNIEERVKNEIIQIINDTNVYNDLFPPTINEIQLENYVNLIRKLNLKEIPKGIKKPIKRKQEVILYERDPRVKVFILQRANEKCELCKNVGPFKDRNGILFLEVHHLLSLSLGGEDTIYNTVAVCPNCHRELHYGVNAEDKKNILLNYLNEIYKQN